MISRLRRHTPYLRLSLGLVALAATHTAPASGTVTEPIRIEYRAPSGVGCPSAAHFSGQVFSRTASARAATPGETARTFIVELRRQGKRVTGSLVIQETDGATMARRVSGSRCSDVATVLALATALAIDPRAELAPRETLDEPSDALEPSTPDDDTTPDDRATSDQTDVTQEPAPPPDDYGAHGPASVDERAAAEGELITEDSLTPAPASEPGHWVPRWAFGATAAFGVAPRTALGVSALFELHREGSEPAPLGELGVELAYRQAGSNSVGDAAASFRFYVARPTLCAWGVALGGPVRILPCVAMELGGVTGVGSDIPNSAAQSRFWATAEVLLRLEVALGAGWVTTLEGGAAAPLTRYKFVFENPDTPIHEVPALTGTAALRVGSSF